jgi:drug/metabolite transporter (DMT)-like permease
LNTGIILSLAAIIIGLILLRDSSTHPFDAMGIFFGIIAAVCYAFYLIGSKKYIASFTIDSTILTTMVCFGCAFIFLILSISSHSFALPPTIKSWVYLFALGILATALPIQLMLKGLAYISSMRASIISVLEPLVTIFVGVLLLHESISHLQLIGGSKEPLLDSSLLSIFRVDRQ